MRCFLILRIPFIIVFLFSLFRMSFEFSSSGVLRDLSPSNFLSLFLPMTFIQIVYETFLSRHHEYIWYRDGSIIKIIKVIFMLVFSILNLPLIMLLFFYFNFGILYPIMFTIIPLICIFVYSLIIKILSLNDTYSIGKYISCMVTFCLNYLIVFTLGSDYIYITKHFLDFLLVILFFIIITSKSINNFIYSSSILSLCALSYQFFVLFFD